MNALSPSSFMLAAPDRIVLLRVVSATFVGCIDELVYENDGEYEVEEKLDCGAAAVSVTPIV